MNVMLHGISLDLSTAAYATIIPFLCYTFKSRRFITLYYSLLSLLISTIFIADTIMYSYWGFKIDASIFIYTDNPDEAFASMTTIETILAIISIIVITVLLFLIYNKALPPYKRNIFTQKATRKGKAIATLKSVFIVCLLVLLMRGGIDVSTANISRSYFSSNQFLNHAAVNPIFSLGYSLCQTKDLEKEYQYFDNEERKALTKDIYNINGPNYINLLKTDKPNILLILWEGCGSTFVDLLNKKGSINTNSKEITPNLNRLISDGILFSNCYANSYRTDRGMVCTLNGWLGLPTISLMKQPKICRKLPSIAKSLKSNGYSTQFWYGGDIDFINMGSYLSESGYTTIKSGKDFCRKDRRYSKWGVPDNILLDSVADYICKQGNQMPWFTTVLTLSSHEPWEVPYDKFKDPVINSFAYTDSCIGKFVGKLRKSNQWDNTLIVILPDHGIHFNVIRNNSTNELTTEKTTNSDYNTFQIPIIWAGGALNKKDIAFDKIMNQSDLAATLLSQMGISHKDFLFSRNVLCENYSYPFAFLTFNNGMSLIDSTGITIIDNISNEIVFNRNSKKTEDKSFTTQRANRAKAILQTLYEDIAKK